MIVEAKSELLISIDIDWACEYAISMTLSYFLERGIPVTVFSTHDSNFIANQLGALEVGLHPFFDETSSHGSDNYTVATYVNQLPHNIKAFRCHRFQCSNSTYSLMRNLGFKISSNVCTDLEVVYPFKNRFQMLEIPIYMEDGGFLFNQHSMDVSDNPMEMFSSPGTKVIVLHPMHFVINTPHWEYMVSIKRQTSREVWRNYGSVQIKALQYSGKGIRDFVQQVIANAHRFTTIGELANRYQST